MTAIRFIRKNNEGNSIHRYITGLSEAEIKAIWDLMMIEEIDDGVAGHFLYENVDTGVIEYPKPEVEYREIEPLEAEYFVIRDPSWENIRLLRRERAPLNPRVGKILATFPEHKFSDRVMFKKPEVVPKAD